MLYYLMSDSDEGSGSYEVVTKDPQESQQQQHHLDETEDTDIEGESVPGEEEGEEGNQGDQEDKNTEEASGLGLEHDQERFLQEDIQTLLKIRPGEKEEAELQEKGSKVDQVEEELYAGKDVQVKNSIQEDSLQKMGPKESEPSARSEKPKPPLKVNLKEPTTSGFGSFYDDPDPQVPKHQEQIVKPLQAGDLVLTILAWRIGAKALALTTAARFASHVFVNQQMTLAKGNPGEGGSILGIWVGFSILQGILHRVARFRGERGLAHLAAILLGQSQGIAWSLCYPQTLLSQIFRNLWMAFRTIYVVAIRKLRLEGTVLLPRHKFPANSSQVDPKWLSKVLNTEITNVRVLSLSQSVEEDIQEVTEEDIEKPRGFIGETVRLVPEYLDAEAADVNDLPHTLILKMASTNPSVIMKMRPVGVYLRETHFYSKLVPLIRTKAAQSKDPILEVPHCYASDYDPFTTEFCLLFEDAAPLLPGCEVEGGTWQKACSVATRYARFHALFWRPSLQELNDDFDLHWHSTYNFMKISHPAILYDLSNRAFSNLMTQERYASLVSPAMQRTLRTYFAHMSAVLDELCEGPMTFTHADARSENMIWPASVEGVKEDKICHAGLKFDDSYDRKQTRWLSVDWQTSSKGVGVSDLSYFVGLDLNVSPEAGDTCDRVLVGEYYRTLVQALENPRHLGKYSADDCWRDYRLSLFIAAMIPIVVLQAEGIGSGESERLKTVREHTLRRVLQAIERVDAGEVLLEVVNKRVKQRTMNGVLTAYRHVEDKMLERDRAGILLPGERPRDAPVVVRSATPQDEPFCHFNPVALLALEDGPKPVPGTGRRDAYDRWFLNGYAPDGAHYFAAALGFYPGRGVMDASFSFVVDGEQYNARVSRKLTEKEWPSARNYSPGKRLEVDSNAGPIRIIIKEPLKVAELIVRIPGKMEAHLTMRARFEPIMEPPYSNMVRGIGDFTYDRFTQLTEWKGWIKVNDGDEISADGWWGTRDRSWGRRPHGAADKGAKKNQQGGALLANPLTRYLINQVSRHWAHKVTQFYWFWTPINVPNGGFAYHSQQSQDGTVDNGAAHIFGDPFGPEHAPYGKVEAAGHSLEYSRSGTRHFETCTIVMVLQDGRRVTLKFEPIRPFYMTGIGYGHDTMPHGMGHPSDLIVQCDKFKTEMADRMAPLHWHIQEYSFVRCELHSRDAGPDDPPVAVTSGVSGAEQLVIGPHDPSGFTSAMDA